MMRLSERERTILSCVQLKADRTVPEIAELCGYRCHSVQECLQRLRQRGLLVKMVWINWAALGLTAHQFFFAAAPRRKAHAEGLVSALRRLQFVSRCAEVGGEFQFEIQILSRKHAEVSELLEKIYSAVDAEITQQIFATEVSQTVFGSKFLGRMPGKNEILRRSAAHGEPQPIDEIDHRLLRGLAAQYVPSLRNLAAAAGEAHSTVKYRLERMQKNGVILGYYHVVKPECFGMLPFVFLIRTRGGAAGLHTRLLDFCRPHRNIDTLWRLYGGWDLQLTAQVEDFAEAMQLSQDLHARFGSEIQQVRVYPFFTAHKISSYPFEDSPFKPIRAGSRALASCA